MEGTPFLCAASCATAPSSRCFGGGTSGALSGTEEGSAVRDGTGGRREFFTGAEAPSGTLEGVLVRDTVALGHGSLGEVSGVELSLLAAALNAWSNPTWPELAGFNETVVSRG